MTELCWLIVYDNGESGKDNNKDSGSGVGYEDIYKRSTKLVLVPPLNLYLLLGSISVSTSRLSSCSISYYLLTTFKLLTTVLRKNVNNFGLRPFYSKQDIKDAYYSPA